MAANHLAFFDFDSTLIRQEIIDELAAENGKKEEVERLTRETMEGKHDFLESLRLRTSALAGLKPANLERVAKKITFRSNLCALEGWLKANNFATAIISGSFENVLNRIEGIGRFDHVFANHLVEKEGVLTGEVVAYVTDNKGSIANGLQERLGIQKSRCFAAGDGSTDVPVFKECGFSIAINGKAKAKEAATVAIDTNDLAELIPHLERWLKTRGQQTASGQT